MTTKSKIGTCECCDHDNVKLTKHPYSSAHKQGQERWLCRACEQTETSYYEDHSGVAQAELLPVLKTICWGINEIIEQMNQKQSTV